MQNTAKNLENIYIFFYSSQFCPINFHLFIGQHILYLMCAYMVLVGKLEGKRPLARPMHIWKDNGKLDLQEIN